MKRVLSIFGVAVLACGISAAQSTAADRADAKTDAQTQQQQVSPDQRASDTAGKTGLEGDSHNGHVYKNGRAVVGKATSPAPNGQKATVTAEQGPAVALPQTAGTNGTANSASAQNQRNNAGANGANTPQTNGANGNSNGYDTANQNQQGANPKAANTDSNFPNPAAISPSGPNQGNDVKNAGVHDAGNLGAKNDLSAAETTAPVAHHTTRYWWWVLIAAAVVALLIVRWIGNGRRAQSEGVPDLRANEERDRIRKAG